MYAAKGQKRLPWLRHQALHDLVDGLATRLLQRIPEVLRGGIAVQVRLQVAMHARAKGLFAQIVLGHQKHGSGLAIGDAVEHLVDLARSLGVGANRPGHLPAVQIQGLSSSEA